jgi:hypothetical protein
MGFYLREKKGVEKVDDPAGGGDRRRQVFYTASTNHREDCAEPANQ